MSGVELCVRREEEWDRDAGAACVAKLAGPAVSDAALVVPYREGLGIAHLVARYYIQCRGGSVLWVVQRGLEEMCALSAARFFPGGISTVVLSAADTEHRRRKYWRTFLADAPSKALVVTSINCLLADEAATPGLTDAVATHCAAVVLDSTIDTRALAPPASAAAQAPPPLVTLLSRVQEHPRRAASVVAVVCAWGPGSPQACEALQLRAWTPVDSRHGGAAAPPPALGRTGVDMVDVPASALLDEALGLAMQALVTVVKELRAAEYCVDLPEGPPEHLFAQLYGRQQYAAGEKELCNRRAGGRVREKLLLAFDNLESGAQLVACLACCSFAAFLAKSATLNSMQHMQNQHKYKRSTAGYLSDRSMKAAKELLSPTPDTADEHPKLHAAAAALQHFFAAGREDGYSFAGRRALVVCGTQSDVPGCVSGWVRNRVRSTVRLQHVSGHSKGPSKAEVAKTIDTWIKGEDLHGLVVRITDVPLVLTRVMSKSGGTSFASDNLLVLVYDLVGSDARLPLLRRLAYLSDKARVSFLCTRYERAQLLDACAKMEGSADAGLLDGIPRGRDADEAAAVSVSLTVDRSSDGPQPPAAADPRTAEAATASAGIPSERSSRAWGASVLAYAARPHPASLGEYAAEVAGLGGVGGCYPAWLHSDVAPATQASDDLGAHLRVSCDRATVVRGLGRMSVQAGERTLLSQMRHMSRAAQAKRGERSVSHAAPADELALDPQTDTSQGTVHTASSATVEVSPSVLSPVAPLVPVATTPPLLSAIRARRKEACFLGGIALDEPQRSAARKPGAPAPRVKAGRRAWADINVNAVNPANHVAAAGSEGAAAAAARTWECTYCMHENPDITRRCQTCQERRDASPAPATQMTRPNRNLPEPLVPPPFLEKPSAPPPPPLAAKVQPVTPLRRPSLPLFGVTPVSTPGGDSASRDSSEGPPQVRPLPTLGAASESTSAADEEAEASAAADISVEPTPPMLIQPSPAVVAVAAETAPTPAARFPPSASACRGAEAASATQAAPGTFATRSSGSSHVVVVCSTPLGSGVSEQPASLRAPVGRIAGQEKRPEAEEEEEDKEAVVEEDVGDDFVLSVPALCIPGAPQNEAEASGGAAGNNDNGSEEASYAVGPLYDSSSDGTPPICSMAHRSPERTQDSAGPSACREVLSLDVRHSAHASLSYPAVFTAVEPETQRQRQRQQQQRRVRREPSPERSGPASRPPPASAVVVQPSFREVMSLDVRRTQQDGWGGAGAGGRQGHGGESGPRDAEVVSSLLDLGSWNLPLSQAVAPPDDAPTGDAEDAEEDVPDTNVLTFRSDGSTLSDKEPPAAKEPQVCCSGEQQPPTTPSKPVGGTTVSVYLRSPDRAAATTPPRGSMPPPPPAAEVEPRSNSRKRKTAYAAAAAPHSKRRRKRGRVLSDSVSVSQTQTQGSAQAAEAAPEVSTASESATPAAKRARRRRQRRSRFLDGEAAEGRRTRRQCSSEEDESDASFVVDEDEVHRMSTTERSCCFVFVFVFPCFSFPSVHSSSILLSPTQTSESGSIPPLVTPSTSTPTPVGEQGSSRRTKRMLRDPALRRNLGTQFVENLRDCSSSSSSDIGFSELGVEEEEDEEEEEGEEHDGAGVAAAQSSRDYYDRCYRCGREGHFANQCTADRGAAPATVAPSANTFGLGGSSVGEAAAAAAAASVASSGTQKKFDWTARRGMVYDSKEGQWVRPVPSVQPHHAQGPPHAPPQAQPHVYVPPPHPHPHPQLQPWVQPPTFMSTHPPQMQQPYVPQPQTYLPLQPQPQMHPQPYLYNQPVQQAHYAPGPPAPGPGRPWNNNIPHRPPIPPSAPPTNSAVPPVAQNIGRPVPYRPAPPVAQVQAAPQPWALHATGKPQPFPKPVPFVPSRK